MPQKGQQNPDRKTPQREQQPSKQAKPSRQGGGQR